MDIKDIRDIRVKALLATPGPWTMRYGSSKKNMDDRGLDCKEGEFLDCYTASKEDLSFIAAVNPAVVIELLDALEWNQTKVLFLEKNYNELQQKLFLLKNDLGDPAPVEAPKQ